MKNMSVTSDVERSLVRLERQVGRLRWTCAFALVAWGATLSTSFATARRDGGEILRARGLVIEDARGRARILLGAPAPDVAERKRRDPAVGLVLLGEDGADRMQLGHTGGPQMGGVVQPRIAGTTGLAVNDTRGEERGGFGLLDNGRIALGLDGPDGEAVMLFVAPDLGMNGLMINPPKEDGTAVRLTVSADGGALRVADGAGVERLHVGLENGEARVRAFAVDGKLARDLLDDRDR